MATERQYMVEGAQIDEFGVATEFLSNGVQVCESVESGGVENPPENTAAPVLAMTSGSYSLDFGTWDDKGLGPLVFDWVIYRRPGDTIVESDTDETAGSVGGSGTYADGTYYARVTARNTELSETEALSNDDDVTSGPTFKPAWANISTFVA